MFPPSQPLLHFPRIFASLKNLKKISLHIRIVIIYRDHVCSWSSLVCVYARWSSSAYHVTLYHLVLSISRRPIVSSCFSFDWATYWTVAQSLPLSDVTVVGREYWSSEKIPIGSRFLLHCVLASFHRLCTYDISAT